MTGKETFIGMAVQFLGIVVTLWIYYNKISRDQAKQREKDAEWKGSVNAKLDVLYHWWEYKVERRAADDERRYEMAVRARLAKGEDNANITTS